MEKSRSVEGLKKQVSEKEKLLTRYNADRKNLLPKGKSAVADRLQKLMAAAEKVRGYLRYYANQQSSLTGLKNEVQDHRQNRAPETLRSMKERHQTIGFKPTNWDDFLLTFSGDVDATVLERAAEVDKLIQSWKGTMPTGPTDTTGAFLPATADLEKTPLAVLEAEIERLQKIVAADLETAKKLAATTKKIGEENAALERLKERLTDCDQATERARTLVGEREKSYVRVFEAVLGEEKILNELYAPLMKRLKEAGGTLGKLSFVVSRVADVATWAKRGEDDLFDLRGGPFKGIGSLAKEANAALEPAWRTGDAQVVASAMNVFRAKHQEALLEKAPYPRTDQVNYRPWSRRFAQWLYSTDHISIEYGIRYDGIDITKLPPGTRGIVLILLYLALDDADDRPLIIDQPEENLDPKSINDELVPLFLAAKRKRQVIMVTHNANLVVNTDADQIIIAEVGAHSGTGLPPIKYQSGGLDERSIRKVVCDILEGGEQAFKDRARRLRIGLQR